MIHARTILCPVDFSQCSRRALEFAAGFARWTDARLAVLNVGETVSLYPALVVAAAPVAVAHPTRAERAAAMAHFIEPCADPHRPMDVVLEEGDVAATIVTVASRLGADLVVVGTHGQRGFRRLAAGSIARRLAHAAPCPVIVVPAQARALHDGFERVVCRSQAADLAYARAFVEDPASHVDVMPAGRPARDILAGISDGRADLVIWHRASAQLDEILAGADAPVLVVNDSVPQSWQSATTSRTELPLCGRR